MKNKPSNNYKIIIKTRCYFLIIFCSLPLLFQNMIIFLSFFHNGQIFSVIAAFEMSQTLFSSRKQGTSSNLLLKMNLLLVTSEKTALDLCYLMCFLSVSKFISSIWSLFYLQYSFYRTPSSLKKSIFTYYYHDYLKYVSVKTCILAYFTQWYLLKDVHWKNFLVESTSAFTITNTSLSKLPVSWWVSGKWWVVVTSVGLI